jgi:hypothetical protein
MWHGLNVVEIVELLDIRFLFHDIFYAFGTIYPQYWFKEEAKVYFPKHLEILKQHYVGFCMELVRELNGLQLSIFKILFLFL